MLRTAVPYTHLGMGGGIDVPAHVVQKLQGGGNVPGVAVPRPDIHEDELCRARGRGGKTVTRDFSLSDIDYG